MRIVHKVLKQGLDAKASPRHPISGTTVDPVRLAWAPFPLPVAESESYGLKCLLLRARKLAFQTLRSQ